MTSQEKELWEALIDYGIPPHMHAGVVRYVVQRIKPGHFLMGLLTNDLLKAVGHGDDDNLKALRRWIEFLTMVLPADSWGSPEKVTDWLYVQPMAERLRGRNNQQQQERT